MGLTGNEVYNGTDLYIFLAETPVAHATSHSLSVKANVRETSDKETGNYSTRALGRFDVTASCEGLVAYGSFEDLVNKMEARSPVATVFAGKEGETDVYATGTDASYASGYFYITGWDMTAPDADNTTFSVSFEHCSGFAFVTGTA